MALRKIKLGDYVFQSNVKNDKLELNIHNVRGISTQKMFIDTKANMEGVSLNNYKIVRPNQFAYVPDTSRRGDKVSLAFNDTEESFLVSSISVVFSVNEKEINPKYLFMYFNRPEFDRYSRYNSFGSARETFSWEDMCDIDMDLPDLITQQKYVDVYLSMVENQKAYERGLEDLKTIFISNVEQLKKTYSSQSILPFLEERQETNKDCVYTNLVGVGNDGFITPRGSRDKETFYKCNIFYYKDFVYNPSVISKGAIALNINIKNPQICTEEYIVFYIKDESVLLPEYLFLWLKRSETGRFLEFVNMDSVRNRVYFEDLECIKIPIPDLNVQKAIANIYKSYYDRKEINERLKQQIKDICPILIKGSIEEGR